MLVSESHNETEVEESESDLIFGGVAEGQTKCGRSRIWEEGGGLLGEDRLLMYQNH